MFCVRVQYVVSALNTTVLGYIVNEGIRVPEIRLVDATGKQLGVFKTSEALDNAKKEGLDLVEIAPRANPPVVKLIEIGKFKYQEEKKLRIASQKQRGGDLKEIRFSPFIADNDYQTRLTRIREFLDDRNKVRVVVVFKGRQMGSKQFGYDLLKSILQDLGESAHVDVEPKFMGRQLFMILSPVSKKGQSNDVKSEIKEINTETA
jgi:translation initiation factor IF-3